MAHDAALKEKAKELYVVNGFSMDTICTMLPDVSRKTLYNWREKESWESQRRDRVEKTSTRRERLEAALDRALDELEVKFDPKILFSVGKLVAALKSLSTFEFTEEKKAKADNSTKGYSEENLRELEEKFMNL
jgi:hypothetical protein